MIHFEKLRPFFGTEELDLMSELSKACVLLFVGPSIAVFAGYQLVLTPVFKLLLEILMAFALTGATQTILKTFWIPSSQIFSQEVKITLKDAFFL